MIKRNELKSNQSCLNRAGDGERLFVLLARDPAAPVAIRAWIAERLRLGKNTPGDEQIREAFECAGLMELERSEINAARRQEKLPWPQRPSFEGKCCPAHIRADGYHSEDCPTRHVTSTSEATP